MLFDPRVELPVATVRSRSGAAAIAADTRRWLFTRWAWLRPRTVPMIVAFVGMLAVIGSGHYLSRLAQQPPEQLEAAPSFAEQRLAALKASLDAAEASRAPVVLDLETMRAWELAPIPLWPSQSPIRLIPSRVDRAR